jgi:hypothetical protein
MSAGDPPQEPWPELRSLLLSTRPGELGLTATDRLPRVWGALMEMNAGSAVVTVASLADGTTSLYLSTGGGILGGGDHPAVRAATYKFLDAIEAGLDNLTPVTELPLPGPGRFRLHALTYWSPGTLEAVESDVVTGRSPYSPMFQAGNEVITQLRLLQERAAPFSQ